ncbi:hypothetical protein [Bacillus suaedae]|uniref:Uncharacterized protein n=1 Tax=Halalkalibacter suaedae TaxID=2822140 RepID=A0A940WU02_9BACI|nr:hypothetical protein [Bacillus suaedae]MBP3952261.1 hypothetical protein [Bacillus suaedae]
MRKHKYCSKCGHKLSTYHDHKNHHHHKTNCHSDHYDYHRGYHCNHSHHHDCDCHYHHRHLCDDDFRLRLGGLHGGLNFRLRQLIGCDVEIELENNEILHGKVCYVGSNFVELQVEERSTASTDDEERENATDEDAKDTHSNDENCHNTIFSIDKIENVKYPSKCRPDHDH